MKDEAVIIKEFYDSNPEMEWNRLGGFSFEFEITKTMMNRYISNGSKILDIGGGPGRYSLYYASRGCDVTLVDLSDGNVEFAKRKAVELNAPLKAYQADARELSKLPLGEYDHIFIMGPMYHIFSIEDRRSVIQQAKKHLKKGGLIFISFIQLFAGLNYYLSECPCELINEEAKEWFDCIYENRTWSGKAFTEAVFMDVEKITPFMSSCGIKKVTFFGQEGITSSNDLALKKLPDAERLLWLELSIKLCEKEKYMSHSSHLMFVGKIS